MPADAVAIVSFFESFDDPHYLDSGEAPETITVCWRSTLTPYMHSSQRQRNSYPHTDMDIGSAAACRDRCDHEVQSCKGIPARFWPRPKMSTTWRKTTWSGLAPPSSVYLADVFAEAQCVYLAARLLQLSLYHVPKQAVGMLWRCRSPRRHHLHDCDLEDLNLCQALPGELRVLTFEDCQGNLAYSSRESLVSHFGRLHQLLGEKGEAVEALALLREVQTAMGARSPQKLLDATTRSLLHPPASSDDARKSPEGDKTFSRREGGDGTSKCSEKALWLQKSPVPLPHVVGASTLLVVRPR